MTRELELLSRQAESACNIAMERADYEQRRYSGALRYLKIVSELAQHRQDAVERARAVGAADTELARLVALAAEGLRLKATRSREARDARRRLLRACEESRAASEARRRAHEAARGNDSPYLTLVPTQGRSA